MPSIYTNTDALIGTTTTVSCDSGDVALGGGWNITSSGNIKVTGSYPSGTGSWVIKMDQANSGTAYVICANVSS